MADEQQFVVGAIEWRDLTVPDASAVRDFYQAVVGWQSIPHPMGEYEDFSMATPDTGEIVSGVCHARGENANVPPQWLIYINVADVDTSAARCVELGGRVLDGPRSMGAGRFAVIQDPSGAVCALWNPGAPESVGVEAAEAEASRELELAA